MRVTINLLVDKVNEYFKMDNLHVSSRSCWRHSRQPRIFDIREFRALQRGKSASLSKTRHVDSHPRKYFNLTKQKKFFAKIRTTCRPSCCFFWGKLCIDVFVYISSILYFSGVQCYLNLTMTSKGILDSAKNLRSRTANTSTFKLLTYNT